MNNHFALAPVASSTPPPSARGLVSVFHGVFMSMRAMGDSAHLRAALHVGGYGDRFQMLRVHTRRIATEVIQNQSWRDFADTETISPAVSHLSIETAIAEVCGARLPQPTRLSKGNILPKTKCIVKSSRHWVNSDPPRHSGRSFRVSLSPPMFVMRKAPPARAGETKTALYGA